MTTHDVVIVGARAAGAATAMLLARQGHRVLVLDRTAHGSDTLSTHAMMRVGVQRLRRWGLLDRVIAAGTPPLPAVSFDYGGREVRVEASEPLYAPRRTVLDALLCDAAVEAGADVRHDVHVLRLLADPDGTVRGVVARYPDGRLVEHRARLTVGADGMRSGVARAVSAPVTRQGGASALAIYSHVAGLEQDGFGWFYGPGVSAGIIPTNDGASCVFVGTSTARFESLRRDLDAATTTLLTEISPALRDRVAAGRRTGPLRGFPGVPGWLRRPHGPGWALVGDAGYFKDPATAHGIGDAFRDAQLLADAADDALTGRRRTAEAMMEYETRRDRLSLPLIEATEAIARCDWTMEELQRHHLALSAAMKAEVLAMRQWDDDRDAVTVAA